MKECTCHNFNRLKELIRMDVAKLWNENERYTNEGKEKVSYKIIILVDERFDVGLFHAIWHFVVDI